MGNQLLLRGLALIGIGLLFAIPAARYDIGTFSRAGPGLFPLMVAGLVGLIGLTMVVRSRFEGGGRVSFKPKNIAIVLLSLGGFVLIAEHLKAIAAIVFLVFFSTLAGQTYSVTRNLKICVVLIGIAFAFHQFLNLSIALY